MKLWPNFVHELTDPQISVCTCTSPPTRLKLVFVRFCTWMHGRVDACVLLVAATDNLQFSEFFFLHMLSDIKRPSMDTVEGLLDNSKWVNEAAFYCGGGFFIHVSAPELSIAFLFPFLKDEIQTCAFMKDIWVSWSQQTWKIFKITCKTCSWRQCFCPQNCFWWMSFFILTDLFFQLSNFLSQQQFDVMQRQLNLPHALLHILHLPLPVVLVRRQWARSTKCCRRNGVITKPEFCSLWAAAHWRATRMKRLRDQNVLWARRFIWSWFHH